MNKKNAENTDKKICKSCQQEIPIKATKCYMCGSKQPTEATKVKKWCCGFLYGYVILVIIIAFSYGNESDESVVTEISTKPDTVKEEKIELGIIEKIENSLDANSYEVSVWDQNGNFAYNDSTPPFEVIVNTPVGSISSCYQAKEMLLNVMKTFYSNPEIKSNVARVQFTAFGYLRASMGSIDAASISNWENIHKEIGITNFWNTFLQISPYENETGALNTRTWGDNINNC